MQNALSSNGFLILMIASGVFALMGWIVCFILILRRIFIRKSKLIELMHAYPVEIEPDGMIFEKQTIGFGKSLRFRRCATVCVSQAGLYLAVKVIFGKRLAFLIPWRELINVTETRLYGLNAFCFSVGSPEITSIKVYPALFAKFKSLLYPPPTGGSSPD
jgi:hypothetical protein